MNKKRFFGFIVAVFVFVSVLGTGISSAKYKYFYSVGYNKVWISGTPHLKVFFLIPSDAIRIDKSCLVDTSYTNHGSIENWDLDLCYVGDNTNLAILWVPKSFWFSTWYGRIGYGSRLASQLVYLGVKY